MKRIAYMLVVVLGCGGLMAAPAAADTPTPPVANATTLQMFNYYRQMAATINGSSVTPLNTVTENSSWSAGDANHVNYMNQTGTVGHSEDPASPHYTSSGNDAAVNSVLALYNGSQSTQFMVGQLMASPFHAIEMLDSRLQTAGAATGSANGRTGTAIDVFRGRTGPAATSPVVWPGPNTDLPLTKYSGTESPNPLLGCSQPEFQNPSMVGTPLIVRLPSAPSGTTASVTFPYNGSPSNITTCSYDENTYTSSDLTNQSQVRSILAANHAIVIIPAALNRGTTYTVNVHSGSYNLAWSFNVSATVPTAPAVSLAGATSGGVRLHIAAPDVNQDGGSPITGYTVTTNPGNVVTTNPGNVVSSYPAGSTEITLSGLANGTAYTAAVTANNAKGSSPPTQVSFMPTSNPGYWAVSPNGHVDSRGTAQWYGDMGGQGMNAPVVAMAATTTGNGYWLLGGDGGIFSFGDAQFYGSTGGLKLNAPVIGMAATPSGHGYWILAKDGGIFSYGDAQFYGSTGSIKLNQPVIDMSVSASGHGYRLVALDGGVFSFGDAGFYGSMGGEHLNKPVVSMANATSGDGYWMIGADGGIFAFGPGAPFYESLVGSGASGEGGMRIRATGDGRGYWILTGAGRVYPFGNAAVVGDVTAGSVDLTLAPGS